MSYLGPQLENSKELTQRAGHISTVREELDRGVNPNLHMFKGGLMEGVSHSRSKQGRATVLGVAARAGHTEIVKLLLERGAWPNGMEKTRPLIEAVKGGWVHIARLLIDADADVHALGLHKLSA